jgi:hypothetical protein
MTFSKACEIAAKKACINNDEMYVVSERLEDGDDWEYFVADEYDMETFYLGCEAIAVYGPDGIRMD